MVHSNLRFELRLPAFFDKSVSGLCGNKNMIVDDEFTVRNGTVLPPPSDDESNGTNWQEFEVASSWIRGSPELLGCLDSQDETNLTKPDPGPDPDTNITCDIRTLQEVEQDCDEIVNADWLKNCTAAIDITAVYESCLIDLCMDGSNETKIDIVEQLVDECKSKLDEDDPILCEWRELSNIKCDNFCAENQTISTLVCRNRTGDDSRQRREANSDCEQVVQIDGETCVCKEGQFIVDGKCADECPKDGKWANWGEWSKCSKMCGAGSAVRSRLCLGPSICNGDSSETDATCNDCRCPDLTDKNELASGTCLTCNPFEPTQNLPIWTVPKLFKTFSIELEFSPNGPVLPTEANIIRMGLGGNSHYGIQIGIKVYDYKRKI